MKYKFILFSPWLLKSPVRFQVEGFRVFRGHVAKSDVSK